MFERLNRQPDMYNATQTTTVHCSDWQATIASPVLRLLPDGEGGGAGLGKLPVEEHASPALSAALAAAHQTHSSLAS